MGNFGTVPRGTYGKLCPKPPPVLTPRVHMGPIVEAAVPRRSDELPPPSPLKDGPSDLSLRSLSNVASYSPASAFFSRCTLSKLALKPATSSSDRGIIPWLAVPAPRRCLSYILLRCSGPRWPPYQLYLTRSSTWNKISRKSLYVARPTDKCVYVASLARLNTAQTPIPRCLHQARCIVLGCGSFVRGRKRKEG